MKQITLGDLLAKFEPEVHERIRAAVQHTHATHVVLFENVCLDSTQLGKRTALCVGPACTYKEPADVEHRWLNDLPSQRQYPQAVAAVTEGEREEYDPNATFRQAGERFDGEGY